MHTNIVTSENRSTIVIVQDDGSTRLINDTEEALYARVFEAIRLKEDFSQWLTTTTDWFADKASEADVALDDPDAVESLAATIARYRVEERDPSGLIAFMERLAKNPSENSRDQLWNWVQAKDLTIDADGYIVGYKGVVSRYAGTDKFPLDRYPYESSSSGHGFVDGTEVEYNNLPMGVGAVISMPRAEVQDNPTQGCSTGLHVGTHNYAQGYARGALLEVRFDPSDVVSVPSDCGWQKLRCCRYEVVAIHEIDGDDLTAHEAEAAWDQVAAVDAIEAEIPPRFFASLRARLRGNR